MFSKKPLSLLLAIVLIFSFAGTAFSYDQQKFDGSNWMSAVDGSKKITQINMPATHDSATRNVDAALTSKTQKLAITEQLYAGVRFLDIRAKQTKKDFISVHGISTNRQALGLFAKELTVGNIIDECKAFLQNNPGETILFKLKEESSHSSKENFYTDFYNKYIKNDAESWFIQNRIPSLDEVRGKIVLLRHTSIDTTLFDDTNCGINFSSYPYIEKKIVGCFEDSYITPIAFQAKLDEFEEAEVELEDEEYEELESSYAYASMLVEDAYKLSAKNKIEAVKMYLDQDLPEDENRFDICFTNSAFAGFPEKNAFKINKALANYDFVSGKHYGIVGLDFASAELCQTIYMTNEPSMTNIPNEATTGESPYSVYGFLGEFIDQMNRLIFNIFTLFQTF